jgi:heme-degrading monooxygenase HmoA
MILEQAVLQVKPQQQAAFLDSMRQAQSLIAATPGFERLELRACLETPARYLLLVWWQTLANHTEDFRGSDRYQEWRRLLHHFYEPFPLVEHYAEPLLVTGG